MTKTVKISDSQYKRLKKIQEKQSEDSYGEPALKDLLDAAVDMLYEEEIDD